MSSSTLRELRARLASLEQTTRLTTRRHLTGWKHLDDLLPGGGFRMGSLVEWLSADLGSGGTMLALMASMQLVPEGSALVVIDPNEEFYLPAVPMPQVVFLVRPRNPRELLWTWEQVLRCPAVGACVGWIERAPERAFRRLSLAAERAEALGMILRPVSSRREPSWAEARLLVEPRAAPDPSGSQRYLRISLVHARGAISGSSVEVCWNDDAHSLSVAPRLADPAASGSPYRAS
jgi:hypothetical protein